MNEDDEIEFGELDDVLGELEKEEEDIAKKAASEKPADEEKPKDGGSIPEKKTPDKFKGKSIEEVIDSYVSLEQHSGRMANELGELRRLVEAQVKHGQDKDADVGESPKSDPITFEDFVTDPNQAVEKLVGARVKPLIDKLEQKEQLERKQSFESKHSSWESDLADPTFQQWVTKSKYRQNLFLKANQFDIDAADELWSEWAEKKEVLKSMADKEESQKKEELDDAIRKVSTETSSTGASSKKYVSKESLINLQVNDPEKYARLQDKIYQLYQKGLVR